MSSQIAFAFDQMCWMYACACAASVSIQFLSVGSSITLEMLSRSLFRKRLSYIPFIICLAMGALPFSSSFLLHLFFLVHNSSLSVVHCRISIHCALASNWNDFFLKFQRHSSLDLQYVHNQLFCWWLANQYGLIHVSQFYQIPTNWQQL